MQLKQFSVLLAGIGLAAMGAWCMFFESAPVFRGGTEAYSRLAAMKDGSAPIGISLLSQNEALKDCQEVLTSLDSGRGQVQPPELRDRVVPLCKDVATGVIQGSRANSRAELVLALVAEREGDWAALDLHLRQSQALSASAVWLVLPRVTLAERHLEFLSPDGVARHNHDLAMLTASPAGVFRLASLYADQVEIRERIQAVLETVPPQDQERFLGTLRRTIELRNTAL
jgi:hypothetical protein